MASKKRLLKTASSQPSSIFKNPETYKYAAFVLALIATLGSLYFSEIAHFSPCILCWYQRICMYPLVVILAVGILKKEKYIHWYVLPLTLIGMTISIYHNLLYYKVIPEALAPCINGVSCTTKFIQWFGFITIPFLALCGFLLITTCMLVYKVLSKNQAINIR